MLRLTGLDVTFCDNRTELNWLPRLPNGLGDGLALAKNFGEKGERKILKNLWFLVKKRVSELVEEDNFELVSELYRDYLTLENLKG